MPVVTGPVILTAVEFAANPLGVDTSKLLKDATTLQAQASAGATSLSLNDKQGAAPGRFDPRSSSIASYAVDNGDIVFVGAGTPADPMEWVIATGPFTGAGPFALPIAAPGLVNTHPVGSPVSIGVLQQELLSAGMAAERWCNQPIAAFTHPDPRWPPNEFTLDHIWASVDARGIPHIFPPFLPIITTVTPTLQYKLAPGSATGWTSADLTQWEVLTSRLVGPSGIFIRGQFVVFKLGYQSGYVTPPDDAKEGVRIIAASYMKLRGGQAVMMTSGRVSSRLPPEKEFDIPEMAQKLLQPFKAVR